MTIDKALSQLGTTGGLVISEKERVRNRIDEINQRLDDLVDYAISMQERKGNESLAEDNLEINRLKKERAQLGNYLKNLERYDNGQGTA